MATKRKEPIGHTCPDIDAAIKLLMGVKKEIDIYMTLAYKSENDNAPVERTTFYSWSDDISTVAEGRLCSLEDLRSSNSTLREWGCDLISDLEEQDNEIASLNDEISRLERVLSDTLMDKESEISDLKNEIHKLEKELQLIENQ